MVKKTKEQTVNLEEMEKKMADDSIVELDMNLEDYDDYEPLPNGGYPATITLAEMRTSDKGNDYYYITWQVHVDDFPADYAVENAPEGVNLVYARLQKPSAKSRRSITAIKNFYRAVGMSLKANNINPGDWEGKKAKLILKKGEFNGQPTNEIVAVEALD